MTEPCDLSAREARRLIGERKLSPVELLDSCITRIEKTNKAVNAIVAMDVEAARRRASEIEQAIVRGENPGLLAGLPIGVKDLQATAGLRTTWGSLLFKDNVPTADEYSVARVRNAGGVILAKTNTPGVRRRRQHHKPRLRPDRQSVRSLQDLRGLLGRLRRRARAGHRCRSPPARTTAAACARRPSFCGVSGFRTSPGLVPRVDRAAGLSPFGVTGPMGRTIADAHLLLRAQVGEDKRDPFSSSDQRAHPRRAWQRRSRQAPHRRIAGPRLRAGRPRASPTCSARASRPSARPSRRCRSARPTSAACTRCSRCCAACISSPRIASGWRNRATCSTATSSTTPSAA